jgi:hypothetical protein
MVARGKRAYVVHDVHQDHRTKLWQRLAGERTCRQQLACLIQQELETVRVFNARTVLPFDNNRFQILRSHDCAWTSARQGAFTVVHDGCNSTQVLTCRANT